MKYPFSRLFFLSAIVMFTFIFSWLQVTCSGGELRLISRKDFETAESWRPRNICGKDYWLVLSAPRDTEHPGRRWKEGERNNLLYSEPLAKEAAYRYSYITFLETSQFYRMCIREIELYGSDNKRNLALSAGVEARVAQGRLHHIERINDADTGANKVCFSDAVEGAPLKGKAVFSFKQPVSISRAVIYSGYLNQDDLAYVAGDINIRYRIKDIWKPVSVTKSSTSKPGEVNIEFTPVKTSKLEIAFDGQTNHKGMTFQETMIPQGDAPFLFSYLRYGAGHFFTVPESETAREIYELIKKKCPERFMGFWLGEWYNDFRGPALPWDESEGYFRVFVGSKPWYREVRKKYFQGVRTDTKEDICKLLEREFNRQKKRLYDDVYCLNSIFTVDHMGLEWGGNMSATELTGYDRESFQLQMAFTRGAAHQYDKPWLTYSAWYLDSVAVSYPAHGKEIRKGAYGWDSGPNYGVSPSFMKRQNFMSYLAGANFQAYEGVPFQEDMDNDNVYQISPHGKAVKEIYEFTQRHPERGVPYTPVALALDFCHGWTPSGAWNKFEGKAKTWALLPYEREDHMISEFTYELFPHIYYQSKEQNGYSLVNSPYGDIFDVIVPNPPSGPMKAEKLAAYKMVVLLGGIKPKASLVKELERYVDKGGTLLINAAQVTSAFREDFLGLKLKGKTAESKDMKWQLDNGEEGKCEPYELHLADLKGAKAICVDSNGHPVATVNRFGKGRVVVTLPDYLMSRKNNGLPLIGWIMKKAVSEALPLQVEGSIQYLINKVKDGWWVGLINNRGVYKDPREKEIIVPEEKSKVKIVFPGKLNSVHELCRDKSVPVTTEDKTSVVQMTVPAGDVRVIKLVVAGE